MSPFRAGNGHPERRRPGDHPKVGGNREDDPDLTVARGVVKWWKWLATKRMLVMAASAALASVVTWVGISLTLTKRVSTLETGFVEVKREVRQLRDTVSELKSSERDKLYMLCALHERTIPNSIIPRVCRENPSPNP